METFKEKNTIKLQGKSLLRAWQPGVIGPLMEKGHSLREAQRIALKKKALIAENLVKNLVVTDGKELAGDLLIDDESAGLTYHALGTGTGAPAVGDATMGSEQTRKAWTTRSRSGADLTLSVFYTAAQCTYNIKECGVFGGSSASAAADSGALFARYLQSYDNSGGGVDLTFDYLLTVG